MNILAFSAHPDDIEPDVACIDFAEGPRTIYGYMPDFKVLP